MQPKTESPEYKAKVKEKKAKEAFERWELKPIDHPSHGKAYSVSLKGKDPIAILSGDLDIREHLDAADSNDLGLLQIDLGLLRDSDLFEPEYQTVSGKGEVFIRLAPKKFKTDPKPKQDPKPVVKPELKPAEKPKRSMFKFKGK